MPATTESMVGVDGRLGGRTVVVGCGRVVGGIVGRVMGTVGAVGGGGVTTGRVDTGAVGGAVGRGSGLVGGIGRLPGTHVESTYNNPFGDAGPALVTTPRVEAPTRPAETSAGVDAVHTLRYAAATPATCGDAIDVPEMVLLAPGPPTHALVMEEPGANRSRHEPKLENVER